MAKKIDTQITKLFDTLMKKRASVDLASTEARRAWKTHCSFNEGPRSVSPINIQTASQDALVQLYADMLLAQEYKTKAATALGVDTTQPESWCGFSTEDWVLDFKKRLAIIHSRTEKAKLQDLETRLEKIISPEQRREMELEAIMKEME